MKILIVPDSYKGSLTAAEVCRAIREGLLEQDGSADIIAVPFADGGEGFAECMANICNGEILYTTVHDIFQRPVKVCFAACGDTAVIECAQASGLQARKDVMNASSYGTGELIKSAVSSGFRSIILGLGGSGCCDGGAGALAALGTVFYNENYQKISVPKGRDLNDIYGVSFRAIVKDIYFTYACDVENPYFGKNGAAFVFAPQKGASPAQVQTLDDGLRRLGAFLPRDVGSLAGAGAAGGLCGGLYAVYGGSIRSGFDVLAEAAALEEKIASADLIITGEGKTDRQTPMGKLPFRILQLARKHGKECVIVSGCVETDLGCRSISLTDDRISAQEAMENAYEILKEKAKTILQ